MISRHPRFASPPHVQYGSFCPANQLPQAESFIKTLKYEEVYRTDYRNLEEARASIGEFLEKIYNQERLHSALGYRPPLEFERSLPSARAAGRGRA
jgi:putative transposase